MPPRKRGTTEGHWTEPVYITALESRRASCCRLLPPGANLGRKEESSPDRIPVTVPRVKALFSSAFAGNASFGVEPYSHGLCLYFTTPRFTGQLVKANSGMREGRWRTSSGHKVVRTEGSRSAAGTDSFNHGSGTRARGENELVSVPVVSAVPPRPVFTVNKVIEKPRYTMLTTDRG